MFLKEIKTLSDDNSVWTSCYMHKAKLEIIKQVEVKGIWKDILPLWKNLYISQTKKCYSHSVKCQLIPCQGKINGDRNWKFLIKFSFTINLIFIMDIWSKYLLILIFLIWKQLFTLCHWSTWSILNRLIGP